MSVLAVTEQREAVFRKVTYEALSEGKRIAESMGTELVALVLGSNIENAAGELGKYGAEKILVADHEALGEYLTDQYTKVVAEAVAKEDPAVLILGASTQGKDLSARLSASLGAPLAMECVAVRVEDGNLVATRPMYGGKIVAEVALSGKPQMVRFDRMP